MGMFLSSRERRIDRALSARLNDISDYHAAELKHCEVWAEIHALESYISICRTEAYAQADKIHAMWRRIVSHSGE